MSDQLAPPTPQWRRRKAARPSEIAAAALACFAERGFAATRLEEVAKRAGVTKGTLYLYFPNKEELFKAVVRQAIVPNLASGEMLIAQAAEPAPAVLAQLITNWSKIMSTQASAIPKIVLGEAGNFPDIARFYLEEVVDRGLNLYRRLLQKGVERGEFRPMDIDSTVHCIVAPLILGMLWQHSFERHDKHPLDVNALRHALLELLSHGLAPDRGCLAAGAGTAAARPTREKGSGK
jgi:AcrR family transcriptional regulator